MAGPRISQDTTPFNGVTAATNTSGPIIVKNRYGKNISIFHSMTGQTTGGYITVEFAPEIVASAPNAPIAEPVVWFTAPAATVGTIPTVAQAVNYLLSWLLCPTVFIDRKSVV